VIEELRGSNIQVVFGQGKTANHAVKDANITVGSDEIVGMVGESGSGKTTLGRVLAGVLKPSMGEVRLNDDVVLSPGRPMSRQTHRQVQMILQDPYTSLNPSQRAWECVAEVLRVCRGLPANEARREAVQQLGQVGINAVQAHHFPRHLSGGQRQRVSIARALAAQPKFLIADEPTSSIDQSAQAQVLRLLAQIRKERSLGILFITHDLRVVRHIAQRVYVMWKGEIVETGTAARIFSQPAHPYTASLIDAIPGRRARIAVTTAATTESPA
jgi:ABC-type dipeptide/oligopeptide/nickel transport system ATPase subunit